MANLGIINRKIDKSLNTCIKSYQLLTSSHHLSLHRFAYTQNMMEIFVKTIISRFQKAVWSTITVRRGWQYQIPRGF